MANPTVYQAGGAYNLQSYTGGLVFLGSPTLYLAGISISSPPGSNLPAPRAVGRYGEFNRGLFLGSGVLNNESKQFPVIIGKAFGFVSFANLTVRGGAGGINGTRPPYGN